MKIAIIDTYYPEFLKTLKIGSGTYQEELDKVLSRQFGTADFYSREFRKLGWGAIDVIANYGSLQELWWKDNLDRIGYSELPLGQLSISQPDVVFVQDLAALSLRELKILKRSSLLVLQLSCAFTDIEKVKEFHTVFTSFPHYIHKLKNAIYMPLAFAPITLPVEWRLTQPDWERPIDCLFVGGIGWQWNYGRMVMEKVAAEIPGAQFYGYGFDSLPDSSPLKQKYRGPAWGDEMYALMQRAKVVVNRHGEISAQYANNMRLFEATGSGALLVTENKQNLHELFRRDEVLTYNTPDEAVERIQSALNNWNTWGKDMAAAGQKRTLTQHTYAHRVPQIAKILENAMATA